MLENMTAEEDEKTQRVENVRKETLGEEGGNDQ
jgi:hypothetical protein